VSSSRVRQLDGLRALAVMWVVLMHLNLAVGRGGLYGVDVFFVLSGFLITGVLLGERSKRGRVSLWRFYARRVLRLYPALVAMVLLLSLDGPFFSTDGTWGSWLRASAYTLTYTSNLAVLSQQQFDLGALGPTWSLAVEEQFYLVWPLVLIVLLSLRPRRAWVVGGLVVVGLGLMSAFWWSYADGGRRGVVLAYFRPDVRFGELLLGCALAFVLAGGGLRSRRADLALTIATPLAIAGIAVARVILWDNFEGTGNPYAAIPLVAVCATILVARLATSDTTWLSRALRWGPLPWIGAISYGIYLWHSPVMMVLVGEPGGPPAPLGRAVLVIAVTILLAWLSHRLVERPFLRLKERLRTTPVAGLSPRPTATPAAAPAPVGVTAAPVAAVGPAVTAAPIVAEASLDAVDAPLPGGSPSAGL
jgi:peptidoglycan/LPS O-acetylase OafA/YrhL